MYIVSNDENKAVQLINMKIPVNESQREINQFNHLHLDLASNKKCTWSVSYSVSAGFSMPHTDRIWLPFDTLYS